MLWTCRVVDQEFKADFLETISWTRAAANEENKLEEYFKQRSAEFKQQTNTNVNIDKIV